MNDTCILLVEDEANDILLLKIAFEDAGIAVPLRVVTDGQMAVDYLSGAGAFADRNKFPTPCLVLLDLKLPRKSGFEVLKWIREQPPLRRIVVIVFTSAEHEQDVAKAYELGANSYVVKAMDVAQRNETTRFLKGWWLQCNRFAPLPRTMV
jgi:CheY-like chemotaxis protein